MIAAIPGIDETAPTLLYPGIFQRHPIEGARTWRSLDRTAMHRLHEKGPVSDPAGMPNSTTLTNTGLREAEAVFRRLFEADNRAARGTGSIVAASLDVPRR